MIKFLLQNIYAIVSSLDFGRAGQSTAEQGRAEEMKSCKNKDQQVDREQLNEDIINRNCTKMTS